jgi:hypothetical protein
MFTQMSRILYLLLVTTLLIVNACGSDSSANIEPLPNSDYSTDYKFLGDANFPSRLSLSTQQHDITYSAQVSDDNGKIITTVDNTTLQTMEFIIPAGAKQYYVNVATQHQVWLDNISLSVNPISESNNDNAQHMNIAYSERTTSCELWAVQEAAVYLYMQPSINAQPILILPVNIAIKTDARTLDGWYRLTIEGNTGWINGNSVQLNGNCATLPVDTMIQPTSTSDATSTAPYDVDRHYFSINANQGGLFSNKVSYPNGDSTDIIQATLSDSQKDRTIGLIMVCYGTGSESLRWGQIKNITLGCGDTLDLSFPQGVHDVELTVLLPAVNGQQYVDYQLTAMPIAPSDEEQHVMVVDLNQGGALQQMVSYPAGDTQDIVALYGHNLQSDSPNNFREFTVVMRCKGNQTENLQWGTETASLGCGESLTVSLSHAEAVRYLTVNITPHEGQSFIDYTLYALPSAPIDEAFWFGTDRDDGGTFNETLSSPIGDMSDTIAITMSNLTLSAPNDYREMTLTLKCDGFNQANIRWGLPDSPDLECGQTVTTTFIHAMNQQSIEIVPIDINVQTYVNYTLVVAPKVEEAILQNATG